MATISTLLVANFHSGTTRIFKRLSSSLADLLLKKGGVEQMFYSPFSFLDILSQGRLGASLGHSPLVASFSPLLLNPCSVVCSRSLVIRHLVWFHIRVEKMTP